MKCDRVRDLASDATEMHIKSLDAVGLSVTNAADQDLFVVTPNGRVTHAFTLCRLYSGR